MSIRRKFGLGILGTFGLTGASVALYADPRGVGMFLVVIAVLFTGIYLAVEG